MKEFGIKWFKPSQEQKFTGILGNDGMPIIQKLAPKFGVVIDTLRKEGETYICHNDSKIGKPETYWGTVPQGKSYVRMRTTQGNDLSDFWNAVDAEIASQQNPSNPPKI